MCHYVCVCKIETDPNFFKQQAQKKGYKILSLLASKTISLCTYLQVKLYLLALNCKKKQYYFKINTCCHNSDKNAQMNKMPYV